MLQCTACTSRHRHSNYDVIMSPSLGGGVHSPSASTFKIHRYVADGLLLVFAKQPRFLELRQPRQVLQKK